MLSMGQPSRAPQFSLTLRFLIASLLTLRSYEGATTDLAADIRSKALRFENAISMELRSGEKGVR